MVKFYCNGNLFWKYFGEFAQNLSIGGMKNMKTRTQNRTPKRLLSVFLSILMLLSSFVFVNPTISKAATSITHTPRASKVVNYLEGDEWSTIYNVDYPTTGRSVKYSDGANFTNIVATFCANSPKYFQKRLPLQ